MQHPIKRLRLWIDLIPRTGPGNMAVDEWLMESSDCSILRVYDWDGAWGSCGRFCCLDQAIDFDSSVCWVRRSTGGGLVDHQNDWTYSLVIPETENLARIPAVESYRIIHEVLSIVLIGRLNLVNKQSSTAELGGACFEKPVESDVVNDVGAKIAGAGQRRTKQCLLHQGSVAGRLTSDDSIDRSRRFASMLAENWNEISINVPKKIIDQKVADRYGNPEWTQRR